MSKLNELQSYLSFCIKLAKQRTDENDHTGAIEAMAQYAKKKHSGLEGMGNPLRALSSVRILHDYYGELTQELKTIRSGIHNQIMSLLTVEEAEFFHDVM